MDIEQLLQALTALIYHRNTGGAEPPAGAYGQGSASAGLDPDFLRMLSQAFTDPASVQWGSGVNVPPGAPVAAAPDPATVAFGGGVNVASPATLSGNPDAPADAIWGPPPDPYAPYPPSRTVMHPAGQVAPTGPVPQFRPIPAQGPRVPIRGGTYAPDTGFMDAALAYFAPRRPGYRVGGRY